MTALSQLESLVRDNLDSICEALHKDLGKPKPEALVSEAAVILDEISFTKKHLKNWMRPKSKSTPINLFPSKSWTQYEPLGVVLIISPWNYPLNLALSPLVGALAAGNCVVLKPSEVSQNTTKLLSGLIPKYFSHDYVRVIEGGVVETTELLKLQFDHVFFTGSTSVGKIIMKAAAENLVPVTLELGGKSPTIVTENANLDLSARRIVWGKFYNAGQTCVAPDYVCVQESVKEVLLEKLKKEIQLQFGERPKDSKDFGRIINIRNLERLSRLIQREKIFCGGEVNESGHYIAPTILSDIGWDDEVMKEEIFGPILPILTYKSFDELLVKINQRPKPLSAYLFSESSKEKEKFAYELSFGGACINDVLIHLSNPNLPFGGVGESGMGAYHGKASFKAFSHCKSILARTKYLDFSARYAPYTEGKVKFLRRMLGL